MPGTLVGAGGKATNKTYSCFHVANPSLPSVGTDRQTKKYVNTNFTQVL